MGIEVIDWPWYDAAAAERVAKELIAGRTIAADVSDIGEFNHFNAGFSKLPDAFNELRWSLTPAEVERYRDGARRTSIAMEAACRRLTRGINEHEVSGILDEEMHRHALNPVVNLIASDDRIAKYRHPIAANKRVERSVMLVICSEFAGLITSMTRFVSFVPLTDDLKRRQRAVANVDAAINFSTRPGRTLGEMFQVLQNAYAEQGFVDEWKLHHQGGSAGYSAREAVAVPNHPAVVRENQAFAWNPSITGVKSEDTMLASGGGIEFLTQPSKDWPTVVATFEGREVRRPDILVV
jgi:antitoxin VapB